MTSRGLTNQKKISFYADIHTGWHKKLDVLITSKFSIVAIVKQLIYKHYFVPNVNMLHKYEILFPSQQLQTLPQCK